jgi:mRNA-degrading endonuclease RelE of RelBE toxin-antitoxin system
VKEVRWSARASDDLASLDPGIARRVIDGLQRYADTENGDVVRLKGGGGILRLRIGDWRVLFENVEEDALRILRVFHRSKAYR